MVILYIAIFYHAKLYSDMLLQVVYVFLQLYGWHAWLRGGPNRIALPVSRIVAWQVLAWLVACAGGTYLLGTLMYRHTDASFPYVDAFTTVASLIAQWLMARKLLESWLAWIVVDVVSIGLYLRKDLYLTAGLYTVFLFLATLGYFAWRRTLLAPVTE
jgi:nicotinamide mononucleotide transporter